MCFSTPNATQAIHQRLHNHQDSSNVVRRRRRKLFIPRPSLLSLWGHKQRGKNSIAANTIPSSTADGLRMSPKILAKIVPEHEMPEGHLEALKDKFLKGLEGDFASLWRKLNSWETVLTLVIPKEAPPELYKSVIFSGL